MEDTIIIEGRSMPNTQRNRDLQKDINERNAIFANPTLEAATAWLRKKFGEKLVLVQSDVPLASAHKARLQWIGASDAMMEESRSWLVSHGYDTTFYGAPPLTPDQRDADRMSRGLPPLGSLN